jgi:acyl-coenzyme A thioesterase PaaI-like protein
MLCFRQLNILREVEALSLLVAATPRCVSVVKTVGTTIRAVTEKSIQETYAPQNRCFGCGPANEKGLRIRSFREGDEFVCDWTPEPHHAAFDNVLNGGIIGALLDCHSNWAATIVLMERNGSSTPPCTVTSDFHVFLKRPTPMAPLRIRAHVVEASDDRAVVEASIESNGKITDTCRGTFVAVKEGHPAYHRW